MNGRRERLARVVRVLFLVPIIVAGLLTTLATGGGDDSRFAPVADTSIAITSANAHDVASALIIGIKLSLDLGDVTGTQIPSDTGAAPALLQKARIDRLTAQFSAPFGPTDEPCDWDGTVTLSGDIAVPGVFSVGDRLTAVFHDCDDNEGYVLNGELTLTVGEFSGDLLTGLFLISLDVRAAALTITDGTEVVSIDGDFTLSLDTSNAAIVSLVLSGTELEFVARGETFIFTDFVHEVEEGVTAETIFAEVGGTLSVGSLGGTIAYETIEPIEAGEFDPDTGEILITGARRSTVRIRLIDATSIVLEVDENGDGVVDAFIDTNWGALNGQNSTVNSTTAPAIAGEAIAVAGGFGSATLAAGAQFQPSAPFASVAQLALSGSFGPLPFACALGGTAAISGVIAIGGTFSSGDQLAADYSACARGFETLSGGLEITVTDFQGIAGGLYRVTSSAAHSALERSSAALVSASTGSLTTTYDQAFSTSGVIDATGTATNFSIDIGGIARQLSNVTAHVEVALGATPRIMRRTASGRFTSPLVEGAYTFEHVVPDSYLADTDPATGPFEGQLRVEAGDGSSVTIVAQSDSRSVQLVIDLDGDSFTDAEISTTWSSLQ